MSKKTKKDKPIQPKIIPLLNLDTLYKEVIRQVSKTRGDLESKYLYLGWHGAQAWKDVDSSYKISSVGTDLIKRHYKVIDEIIRNSSDNNNFNIVSLGSGICEEDKSILDILRTKFLSATTLPTFKIIPVDISIDLLNEGSRHLAKKVNENQTLLKIVQDIIPINIDIAELVNAKTIIDNHRKKPTEPALFHLLGLTIGNNSETRLMKAINDTMNVNDYLLVGVDFCADDEEILKQTKAQYHGEGITETINKYLCSPLIFASKYVKDDNTDHLKFSIGSFNDLEIAFSEDNNVSDIPNTKSFVYRYKYKDSGVDKLMKACYSHKYKASEFKKFIEEALPKQEVHFEIVNDICSYGDAATRQYLVLLKKVGKIKTVLAKKVPTISNKEKQEAISFLSKVNLEIKNQSVKSPVDESLMTIYKTLTAFINSNNADEAKLAIVIAEIKKENSAYNLKTLAIVQSIENLSK